MSTSEFEIDIASIGKMESIPLILSLVKATTGLRFAAVARVTTSRWVACAVDDSIGLELAVGSERLTAETLCGQVHDLRRSLVFGSGFAELSRLGYEAVAPSDLPAVQSHISIPIITANGELFGTLCALDVMPVTLNKQSAINTLELFAQLIAVNLSLHDRLEQSESQLVASTELGRLREQFIAVLGHDLRTPLSAVRLSADALRANISESRRLLLAEGIRLSAARMAALIEDILDFTRCQLGGDVVMNLRRADDIFDVLGAVVQEVRLAHPEANITFDYEGATALLCDVGRISQLVSNLLTNAVAHGQKGGAIVLKGRIDEGMLVLSCINGGQPIPDTLLGSLFEPFTRTDRDSHTEGLGLGLYICSQVAEAHGGTLSVTSNKDATIFVASIPVRL